MRKPPLRDFKAVSKDRGSKNSSAPLTWMTPENATFIPVSPESKRSANPASATGNTTTGVARSGSMMVVASAVPKEVMPPSSVVITTDLKILSADRVTPPTGRLSGAEMSISGA